MSNEKFTSAADIQSREHAIKYLAKVPVSSMMMFMQLPWEQYGEDEMRANAGAFTVLHNHVDGWWELGFHVNSAADVTVERYFSMEEVLAHIVLKFW